MTRNRLFDAVLEHLQYANEFCECDSAEGSGELCACSTQMKYKIQQVIDMIEQYRDYEDTCENDLD